MPSLFDPSMTGSGAAPSGGGFGMDPLTVYGLGQGLNALGGLLGGGGGGEDKQGNLHLVNSGQQALWNQMAQRAMSGQGDYGYGAAAKSAKGQIQGMLEDRGISQDSGLGMQAMAQGYGAAAAQDAQNRRNTMIGLLQSPLQVAQTAGANFIPGSPSGGASTNAQEGQWDLFRGSGFVGPGVGGQMWGTGQDARTRWLGAQAASQQGQQLGGESLADATRRHIGYAK